MKNFMHQAAFALALFLPGSAPELLPLRDGGILFATIEGHSRDRLQVLRLDTGGHLSLPWGLLDPAKERELKLGYGYIEAAVEEELVSADRLTLDDGSEWVGLIVGRDEGRLMFKNSQALMTLPLERIVGPAVLVQAPAAEIYTREERYQLKLKAFGRDLAAPDGRIAAQAHVDLALWCEGVRDFERAVLHYSAVTAADSTWPAADLEPALERTRVKAAAQVQVDALDEVERLTRQGRFDRALNRLASFGAEFPESPLMADWNIQRERTLKAQLKALRSEVAKRWHAAAAREAREAALLETYAEVLAYLDGPMGKDVLASVTRDLQKLAVQIQPEEVELLFAERTGGRWRKASYGNSTWLLGEQAARAGVVETAVETAGAPRGEQDALRDSIAEKVKRYLANKAAVQAASGGALSASPAEAWQAVSVNSRSNWILAYYAEHSGVMNLGTPRFANCRQCGGSGALKFMSLGSVRGGQSGSTHLETCRTCQGVGLTRRISYR